MKGRNVTLSHYLYLYNIHKIIHLYLHMLLYQYTLASSHNAIILYSCKVLSDLHWLMRSRGWSGPLQRTQTPRCEAFRNLDSH
jgi:hypothetical protein